MLFFYILSWVSTCIHISLITLSVAAGLYYLAELVEEYTVLARKTIRILIWGTLLVYVSIFIFENVPLSMVVCGILSQVTHLIMLRTFPYFVITSVPFIAGAAFVVINHYLAFSHFSSMYYPFTEVLAYFTICLWLVPLAFFVSLSSNDNVLPTLAETKPLISDDTDVVTNYFSKKSKRYGLLSLFNYAKDCVLPQRIKKAF